MGSDEGVPIITGYDRLDKGVALVRQEWNKRSKSFLEMHAAAANELEQLLYLIGPYSNDLGEKLIDKLFGEIELTIDGANENDKRNLRSKQFEIKLDVGAHFLFNASGLKQGEDHLISEISSIVYGNEFGNMDDLEEKLGVKSEIKPEVLRRWCFATAALCLYDEGKLNKSNSTDIYGRMKALLLAGISDNPEAQRTPDNLRIVNNISSAINRDVLKEELDNYITR